MSSTRSDRSAGARAWWLPVLVAAAPLLGVALGLLVHVPSRSASTPPEARAATLMAPDEDSVSALHVGVRLLEQFHYEEAVKQFEKALARNDAWLAAQVDLAIAHLNALEPEHAELAVKAARRAVELAPDDARATYVLAHALAERQRAFGEAVLLLRRVVVAEPGDPHAWYERGRSAQELWRESHDPKLLEEAEQSYRQALARDPYFVEANYKLGRLLLDSPDPARQALGVEVLQRHESLLKGRPVVQQNYLTHGALALAYPWSAPAARRPSPVSVTLRRDAALPSDGAAASPAAGITVADVDADGRLDVVAAAGSSAAPGGVAPLVVSWTAKERPGALGPGRPVLGTAGACTSAPAGDLDGDGDLDLALACAGGNVLVLNDASGLTPQPDGALGGPDAAALALTVVDFDHDGDLDLHAVALARDAGGARAQELWRNDGKARFTDVTAQSGLDAALADPRVAWSDFDGDNVVDLLAWTAAGGLTLFQGDRSGRLRAMPVDLPQGVSTSEPRWLAPIDFDADADLDVGVLAGDSLLVLVNVGKPTAPRFEVGPRHLLAGETVAGLAVADLDLDGAPELLLIEPGEAGSSEAAVEAVDVAEPATMPLLLRRVHAPVGAEAEVVPADLDGDGDVDLVVRGSAGEPLVLWNDLAPGRAWVAVALAGRQGRSNTQGFGAKISVDAGTLSQYREVRACTGFLSHAVAPVPFGLGDRSALDGVSVLWPSGIRQAELDVAPRTVRVLEELDRQPSSCPMLYAWDGGRWTFLTDCFDTAPLGLWVAPDTNIVGEAKSSYRLRPEAVRPVEGVVNLSVAEFLNESLIADAASLRAADHPAGTTLVVDEGVRLSGAAAPFVAWLLEDPRAPQAARIDGRDVTEAVSSEDRRVAGYSVALPWAGLARSHALEVDLADGDGVLVLTGSLNFPNSTSLFASSQAGIAPQPPRLEARTKDRRGRWSGWKEVTGDCGVPAGFHKDVVVDLRGKGLEGPCELRITTNLQVSWDRVACWRGARPVDDSALRDVPLLRAEKSWLGIPREVKGPDDRWREFPVDGLVGSSDWVRQEGPVTPDGDVRSLLTGEDDGSVVILRPGEQALLAFDVGALSPVAPGAERTYVLTTVGWVKDADPHTALSRSVLPLPRPGSPTYP